MRPDMSKILTERERRKSWKQRSGTRLDRVDRDPELCRKREGIRPRGRGRDHKDLNENLSALYRYLDKQVGRPWDKVYSEIVAVAPNVNQTFAHIYTHVWQVVERHVVMIDRKPHYHTAGWRGRGLVPLQSYGRPQYYVCPHSGLLKRAPVERARRHRREIDPYTIRLSELERIQRRMGIWYRDLSKWVFIPRNPERPLSVDRWEIQHDRTLQLSTKELRACGLENRPGEREER